MVPVLGEIVQITDSHQMNSPQHIMHSNNNETQHTSKYGGSMASPVNLGQGVTIL